MIFFSTRMYPSSEPIHLIVNIKYINTNDLDLKMEILNCINLLPAICA